MPAAVVYSIPAGGQIATIVSKVAAPGGIEIHGRQIISIHDILQFVLLPTALADNVSNSWNERGAVEKTVGTMKEFASQIHNAVKSGRLAQPFDAAKVRRACPGWAHKTYNVFLSKHAVGNGRTTELFVRISPGLYRLKNSN
jgi:hypothetical protein